MLGGGRGAGIWVGRGVCAVSCATGLSPNTIRKGLELSGREVDAEAASNSRLREVGGGRKRRNDPDPVALDRQSTTQSVAGIAAPFGCETKIGTMIDGTLRVPGMRRSTSWPKSISPVTTQQRPHRHALEKKPC